MLLAEALQQRADLNAKISDLERRITANALVQEGESPAEDPTELLQEYDAAVKQYGELIGKINLTNCSTVRNGMTLTEIIARKDALNVQLAGYREFASAANQNTYRTRGTEIRVLSTLNVKELRKQADAISKEIRQLDNLLQETNWTTQI